jgi:hypothetical protein
MQATHRHEFTPIFAEFPAIDYRIGRKSDCAVQKSLLTTNCWGFAYSVLSSVQRKEPFVHVLSAGDAQVAYDVFTDDRVFSLIQSVENEQSALLKNQTYRNENLKQGDVVLFWHQNKAEQSVFLDHVAIFIDDDLYYERAGAGDHVPFRLNDWNSILKSWMPGVFNIEWRRVVGDLLPVESAFGMHSVNTLKQIPEAFKIPEKLADQFSIDLEIENGGITGQTYVRIFDFKVASNTIDISRPVYILPESLYSNQSYPLNLSDPFCKISVE